MLLTELGLSRVPKDLVEQKLRGIPRGNPAENNPHRLRYTEVRCMRCATPGSPICSSASNNSGSNYIHARRSEPLRPPPSPLRCAPRCSG